MKTILIRTVGFFMICCPFIFLFILASKTNGTKEACLIFLSIFFLVLWLMTAIRLLLHKFL